MAAFINVFVRTNKLLGAIVSEVGGVLGVELSPRPGGVGELYGAAYQGMDVAVFEAGDYEAERDMDFPWYQVQINLGPIRGNQSRDHKIRDVALSLALRLRQKWGYPTMVTFDLQRLIERHDP